MPYSKNLLFTLALFVLVILFAGSASSASDCSDNVYALTHPECSSGCSNNNYALTHPLECGVVPNNCDDNNYALTHPLECSANPCSDNVYALTHPLECAAACDEKLLDSYRCSGNDRQREKVKFDCSKEWVKLETCAFGCGAATAECNPKKCEPKYLDTYRCSGNQREILELQSDCATQKYVPVGEPCTYGCEEDAAPISSNLGRKIAFCVSQPAILTCFPSASCSTLGCGKFDSCGSFCGACPAQADNAPTAAINVPASAALSSQLSILISGNDDNDVSQLLLYDASNNLLETFDCAGIQTSCSKTFTRTAPSTPNTAYTFKAKSKDSANQLSGFVSGSGATTAALVIPPSVTPPPAPELALPKPLQLVSVKFPLQPLFLRALNFPDSDCVRPGESALLAVKVQNTAKAALKDLKFAAAIPELGIRVSGGPAKLKANGRLTQLLRLDIPEEAEEGTYYLRFSISNGKFSRAVHRTFVVDSSC